MHTIALTNAVGSAITQRCHAVVDLAAEPEVGGVACRSYQHTVALLLALKCHLTGDDIDGLASAVAAAADASVYLLDTEPAALRGFRAAARPVGHPPRGAGAPVLLAQQGALMLREGTRLPAVGCQTGDWSHVDVYLTKTTDYRLLVFAGSEWEPQLAEWTTARGSTVVGVGGNVEGSQYSLRYPGDSDDDGRF